MPNRRRVQMVHNPQDAPVLVQAGLDEAFPQLLNTAVVRPPLPAAWMFPNVDLTVHLHRQPEGRWTGLDTTVVFGSTGQGVTSAVLHDVTGPIGHAQPILTVRPQCTVTASAVAPRRELNRGRCGKRTPP